MRVIRFLGFLLIFTSAIVVSAIVASEIAASAHQAAVAATECETCAQPATAQSMFDLDIRVMEINVSKLKALGFDFTAFWGPSDPWEQLATGGVGSGLVGFLEGLDREGLVQQDVTMAHRVADGGACETSLRWRVADAQESPGAWRDLRLRIRPTLLPSGRVRLESAYGAYFSKTPPTASPPTADEKSLVDFSAEIADQTLWLTANLVGADPAQFPEDEIRVVVLITPHAEPASAAHSGGESCPDLLAPRNVLNHRAAHTADSSRE